MSFKGRIGFDARMWSHPGIGRYIRELSSGLSQKISPERFLLMGYPKDLSSKNFKPLFSNIYSLSEQIELPLKSDGVDLLHVPHFNAPWVYPKKMVVTIHDLIYYHDAKASKRTLGRFYAASMLARIARTADAILTVSEYTKKDLLLSFPTLKPDKVFVAPEAASDQFYKINDAGRLALVRQRYKLDQPFVLFVGSLKRHKNLGALIEVMRSLRENNKIKHELVVVGRKDPRETELLNQIQTQSFVRYLGEVPDEDLCPLYNLADLFVLPSFFEGFGLPVVEAMTCGTPVLCSNRTSLPELVPDASWTFDPENASELGSRIERILNDTTLREKLAVQALAHSQKFTWDETVNRTLSVYAKVLG